MREGRWGIDPQGQAEVGTRTITDRAKRVEPGKGRVATEKKQSKKADPEKNTELTDGQISQEKNYLHTVKDGNEHQ